MPRLGYGLLLSVLTAGGLMLAGCGESESTPPPPGTDTETPVLDIEEGATTPPDQATGEDDAAQEGTRDE